MGGLARESILMRLEAACVAACFISEPLGCSCWVVTAARLCPASLGPLRSPQGLPLAPARCCLRPSEEEEEEEEGCQVKGHTFACGQGTAQGTRSSEQGQRGKSSTSPR